MRGRERGRGGRDWKPHEEEVRGVYIETPRRGGSGRLGAGARVMMRGGNGARGKKPGGAMIGIGDEVFDREGGRVAQRDGLGSSGSRTM
jgi:hypothetical protein